MPVSRFAFGENAPGGDVQRGEQRSRPVADIVVGDALNISEPHRHEGLSSIERLNLALFVNTEHQRVIGRVEIEPHDIAHLLDEKRIGGKLESARAMGLDGKGLKESVNGGFEIPFTRAASRTVQCVPVLGLRDRVRFSNAATRSSSMEQGRPGRSSSYHPGRRRSIKRRRHFPTVALVHFRRLAISVLLAPSADQSTTFARATMAWGNVRDRARLDT